jgi:hypothetical protein
MMTRREVLLASGSAVIAAGLGGCGSTKASRSSSRLGAVHDLMAEQVAQDQFPGSADDAARPGRLDAALRHAPADAPAGRALDVQHGQPPAGRPRGARASGQDFGTFMHQRILAPLGMRDTGFWVPPGKLGRFAGCGKFTDPQTAVASRMDADGPQSAYSTRPVFPSGAGGLVSTVDDYLAFARMLQNGGVHHRTRLLAEQTVREMTTNHLTPQQLAASSFFSGFFDTWGWGYGVGVIRTPDAVSPDPGRYAWFGGFGTSWFNDPARDLIGIVMTQSSDFLFSGARDAFWKAVYAAIG